MNRRLYSPAPGTAMEWLKNLNNYADIGRRRYEGRLSEIEGVPRGQFLKKKRDLLDEPAVTFYRSTKPPVETGAIEGLGPMPDELRALLEWSDGVASLTATRPILEIQIFGVDGIQKSKAMVRDIVYRDELFPPVFRKLLIFGNDFGHRHLAVWVDDAIQPKPVLLIDMECREIFLLSHSLELFFQRIAFALAHEITFRIGTRSKQLRDFIHDSEPGPTYPPEVKGQTQYSLDEVGRFPSSWQSLLGEDDRSFRLD